MKLIKVPTFITFILLTINFARKLIIFFVLDMSKLQKFFFFVLHNNQVINYLHN